MSKNFKFFILFFSVVCYSLFFGIINDAMAKEITILFTGDTHSMLYPCHCPLEPDGGVARRATLVKEMRRKYRQALLLDAGAFFAGGVLDEYTQNSLLDKERTLINLRAMELMKYDAVAVSPYEFNFGKEFLSENIKKSGIVFLSANLQFDGIRPYLIKEVNGVKIGIIGLTSGLAAQKASGVEFEPPEISLKKTVSLVKNKGAKIIVVLSNLGEGQDIELIKKAEGIDILIGGLTRAQDSAMKKINSTTLLFSSWQGRKLGKLSIDYENGKIASQRFEEVRLSDKIKDDPQILSFLPKCYKDSDCKKTGKIGRCVNPGTAKAQCEFKDAEEVSLTVITSKSCKVCDTSFTLEQLGRDFPGLNVSYLYYPSKEAKNLISQLDIAALPAYIFNKDIEKNKNFDNFKDKIEKRKEYYLIKPQFAGLSYFFKRKYERGSLDLFISLFSKDAYNLLNEIKNFKPKIHFLASEVNNTFDAEKGSGEVEEYLRAVCVKEKYPAQFLSYISCRAKDIQSSWWEDCLGNLDSFKIKTCARGQEGKNLLRENIRMNKEFNIMYGPVFLLGNQELFTISGSPKEKDFKKIFKR